MTYFEDKHYAYCTFRKYVTNPLNILMYELGNKEHNATTLPQSVAKFRMKKVNFQQFLGVSVFFR